MTATQIANLALLKIGSNKAITATTDTSREATVVTQLYDHLLRLLLRLHPWAFATKYATLTQTAGPDDDSATLQAWASDQTYAVNDVVTDGDVTYYCILAHSNHEPPNTTYWSTDAPNAANGDWAYAYRWPSDCLFARRIVPPGAEGDGRTFSLTPERFRVGRDVNGLLLYSNTADAVLEYTVIDCGNLYADDLFIEAFACRFGAELVLPLARDRQLAVDLKRDYQIAVMQAQTLTEREQQQEPPGDAEWIVNRN